MSEAFDLAATLGPENQLTQRPVAPGIDQTSNIDFDLQAALGPPDAPPDAAEEFDLASTLYLSDAPILQRTQAGCTR